MWGVLFADATIAGAQTGEGASKQHTREARHPSGIDSGIV